MRKGSPGAETGLELREGREADGDAGKPGCLEDHEGVGMKVTKGFLFLFSFGESVTCCSLCPFSMSMKNIGKNNYAFSSIVCFFPPKSSLFSFSMCFAFILCHWKTVLDLFSLSGDEAFSLSLSLSLSFCLCVCVRARVVHMHACEFLCMRVHTRCRS